MDYLALITLCVGALLALAGTVAQQIHNQLFERHVDTLEAAVERDDSATTISREIIRFNSDRRVDITQYVMMVEPLGWFLLVVGISSVSLGWPL
jgi:hypothetical protein